MSGRSERDHWAKVPREVILRAMAPDQCLDSRLRHAMILWSWCGPEVWEAEPDMVVRKNGRGFLEFDKAGQPIPATLRDLIELLDLAPGMKGHISRTRECLIAQNLVRAEGRVMYLVPRPARFDPKNSEKLVALQGNFQGWNFGKVAVQGNQLPADPVARASALQWLEEQHANFKNERNALNAKYADLLCTQGPGRGILIEEKRVESREKNAGGRSSSIRESSVATAPLIVRTPASPSPIAEKLESWLTAFFRLPTAPDDEILAKIAEHIPDEAAFAQFRHAAEGARPKKWALFVRIAAECAQERARQVSAAEAARPQPQSAEERAANEYVAKQAGETLAQYRKISGNPDAEIEDWFAAQEQAAKEWKSGD
jgi:hypothetical protein